MRLALFVNVFSFSIDEAVFREDLFKTNFQEVAGRVHVKSQGEKVNVNVNYYALKWEITSRLDMRAHFCHHFFFFLGILLAILGVSQKKSLFL